MKVTCSAVDPRYIPEATKGVKKVCLTCRDEKDIILFQKNARRKTGYNSLCLDCLGEKNKKYRDGRRAATAAWRGVNKEYSLAYRKARAGKEMEFVSRGHVSVKRTYAEVLEIRGVERREQKDKVKEWNDRYRKKPESKQKIRDKDKRKRKIDPEYRLKSVLRGRVYKALKGLTKVSGTIDLLGCDVGHLKSWLESRFLSGMSWENHSIGEGKWHIDHIRPCASFDLTDPEQQKVCFHYTNLQPLWAVDNLKKGSKLCHAST